MAERISRGGEFLIAEVACDEIFTPEKIADEIRKSLGRDPFPCLCDELFPVPGAPSQCKNARALW